ncbi:MAG: hypothetical protein J5666_00905 [Bacilli bacterium]|nr:hypothetical protein [Bacilli bacterium]
MKKYTLLIFLLLALMLTGCGKNNASDADWKFDSDNHWHVMEQKKQTLAYEMGAHTFGEWIIDGEAAPDVAGAKHRICSVCGYREDAVIPALDHVHTYGDWIIDLAAQPDVDGSRHHVCSKCGYREDEVIPALDHVHTFEDDWTCDETYHWHEATCGHDLQADYGEHTPVAAATFYEDSVCSVCGMVLEEAIANKAHPLSSVLYYYEPGYYFFVFENTTWSKFEIRTIGKASVSTSAATLIYDGGSPAGVYSLAQPNNTSDTIFAPGTYYAQVRVTSAGTLGLELKFTHYEIVESLEDTVIGLREEGKDSAPELYSFIRKIDGNPRYIGMSVTGASWLVEPNLIENGVVRFELAEGGYEDVFVPSFAFRRSTSDTINTYYDITPSATDPAISTVEVKHAVATIQAIKDLNSSFSLTEANMKTRLIYHTIDSLEYLTSSLPAASDTPEDIFEELSSQSNSHNIEYCSSLELDRFFRWGEDDCEWEGQTFGPGLYIDSSSGVFDREGYYGLFKVVNDQEEPISTFMLLFDENYVVEDAILNALLFDSNYKQLDVVRDGNHYVWNSGANKGQYFSLAPEETVYLYYRIEAEPAEIPVYPYLYCVLDKDSYIVYYQASPAFTVEYDAGDETTIADVPESSVPSAKYLAGWTTSPNNPYVLYEVGDTVDFADEDIYLYPVYRSLGIIADSRFTEMAIHTTIGRGTGFILEMETPDTLHVGDSVSLVLSGGETSSHLVTSICTWPDGALVDDANNESGLIYFILRGLNEETANNVIRIEFVSLL